MTSKAKSKGPTLPPDEDDEPIEDGNDAIDAKWSIEEKQQVAARLQESGTPIGLADVAFDAPAMVQDAYDSCIAKSPGLQLMMDAIMQAARRMEQESWERFRDIPLLNVHHDDAAIHSNLFAQTEPTWRPLMQRPKKRRQPCVFLHIGTHTLTEQLSDFLTKLGWTGVCVGPTKPPKGNEDLLTYVNIDPADTEDQKRMDDLLNDTGGLVPKPPTFQLAYVNVVFNSREEMDVLDPHDEDYEEKLRVRQEEEKNRVEEVRVPGERLENAPLPPPPPNTASGYGIVGLTRNERVRRRLRALRNCLNVALGRLTKDGSLVVLWPGLPVHPVLFFIAGTLRKLFQRVHIFSPEGAKTWDVYILAAGFVRDRADSKVPGIGGLELRSFFDSTWRLDALDDVLLWTLPPDQEDEETSVGITGKGIVAAYTLLWKTWAGKLSSLALDLGMLLSQEDADAIISPVAKKGPKKKKPAPKAKKAPAKAPAENRPGSKELPMPAAELPAEPKKASKEQPASEEPAAVAEAAAAPTATAPAAAEPTSPTPAAEATKRPSGERSGDPAPAAAEVAKPAGPEAKRPSTERTEELTIAADSTGFEEAKTTKPGQARRRAPPGTRLNPLKDPTRSASAEPRPPRKRFSLNRGAPSLSCTFGAAPGSKHKQINYEELAAEYKLVHKALEVARRGKQKHWDLDEDAAGRSVESPKAGDVAKTDSVTKTDSLKLEEEDEAAPAEAEARRSPELGALHPRSHRKPLP